MTTSVLNRLFAVLVAAVLAGCASGGGRAPVIENGAVEKMHAPAAAHGKGAAQSEKDWRPQTYVVQKGDTLYGIAFNYGLDYHEIAELNNIQNADVIQVGQEIRLFSTGAAVAAKPKVAEIKPPQGVPVKDQPRVAKLPYSEQAVLDIQKIQVMPLKPEAVAVATVEPKPEVQPEAKPEAKPEPASEAAAAESAPEWGMPTNGKVIAGFSESANRKGIDIAGKRGQAIVASAPGKVVYSGSGLRGYGKLVIIKHNNTYLSAYAHNDQVLVKEGQIVSKGQKIAEMGSTDSDQVKLHFEIRKFGKPVDPAKYLPLTKS